MAHKSAHTHAPHTTPHTTYTHKTSWDGWETNVLCAFHNTTDSIEGRLEAINHSLKLQELLLDCLKHLLHLHAAAQSRLVGAIAYTCLKPPPPPDTHHIFRRPTHHKTQHKVQHRKRALSNRSTALAARSRSSLSTAVAIASIMSPMKRPFTLSSIEFQSRSVRLSKFGKRAKMSSSALKMLKMRSCSPSRPQKKQARSKKKQQQKDEMR